MFLGSFAIDDTATFYVNSHTPSTGAAVDADAAPGYRVYEDETGTPILTGSMALLDDANTVGFYSEQITLSAANGFELGKSYCIRITIVVGGVTGTALRFLQMGSKVDTRMLGGSVQSTTDLKDFADDGYDPSTNKVQGVVLVDTITTYTGNTVQTGDSFARIGVAGAGLTNIDLPDQTMNITGNITGNLSGSVGSVTAGVTLAASAVQAIWDALTSALTTAGSIGKLLVDNINATISSRLAPTTAGRTLDVTAGGNAGIDWANIESPTTAVNLSATNIDVDQVVASVSGDVGGIGVGGIQSSSFAAGALDAAAFDVDVPELFADELLDRNLAGGGSGDTRNVRNALRPSRNRVSISDVGDVVVYEEDDTTPAWEGSATRDVAAFNITEINPD